MVNVGQDSLSEALTTGEESIDANSAHDKKTHNFDGVINPHAHTARIQRELQWIHLQGFAGGVLRVSPVDL